MNFHDETEESEAPEMQGRDLAKRINALLPVDWYLEWEDAPNTGGGGIVASFLGPNADGSPCATHEELIAVAADVRAAGYPVRVSEDAHGCYLWVAPMHHP